jgi:hypothetical protein
MSATAFQRRRRELEAEKAQQEAASNEESTETGADPAGGEAVGTTNADDNAGGDSETADNGPDDGDSTPVSVADMKKTEVMAELKRLGVPFTDRSSVAELRVQLEEVLAEV